MNYEFTSVFMLLKLDIFGILFPHVRGSINVGTPWCCLKQNSVTRIRLKSGVKSLRGRGHIFCKLSYLFSKFMSYRNCGELFSKLGPSWESKKLCLKVQMVWVSSSLLHLRHKDIQNTKHQTFPSNTYVTSNRNFVCDRTVPEELTI